MTGGWGGLPTDVSFPSSASLTADCLDDVPFDLRYLRVIVYEVRDPSWADKLRDQVTAQLTALIN